MQTIPDLQDQVGLVDRYITQWTEELEEPGLREADAKAIVRHIGLFRGIKENLQRLELTLSSGEATTQVRRQRVRELLARESLTVPQLAMRLNCTIDVTRNLLRPMLANGTIERRGAVIVAIQKVSACNASLSGGFAAKGNSDE